MKNTNWSIFQELNHIMNEELKNKKKKKSLEHEEVWFPIPPRPLLCAQNKFSSQPFSPKLIRNVRLTGITRRNTDTTNHARTREKKKNEKMKKSELYILLITYQFINAEIIRLNNGVLSRKIFSDITFYSQAIPILYTETIPFTEEQLSQYIENAFPTTNGNYSAAIRQHLRLGMSATLIDLQTEIKKNFRTKRGIEFLGKIYQFCCNVMLLSNLEGIKSNEEKLTTQYNHLKNAVIDEHKNLLNFHKNLNNIVAATHAEFTKV